MAEGMGLECFDGEGSIGTRGQGVEGFVSEEEDLIGYVQSLRGNLT